MKVYLGEKTLKELSYFHVLYFLITVFLLFLSCLKKKKKVPKAILVVVMSNKKYEIKY